MRMGCISYIVAR